MSVGLINLRELRNLAKDYKYLVIDSESASAQEIVKRANQWLELNLGSRVLFYAAEECFVPEGKLYGTYMLGTAKQVVTAPHLHYSEYASVLRGMETSTELGLVVEPIDEYDELLVQPEQARLQTVAFLFDEITIPLNNTILKISEPQLLTRVDLD